MLEYKYNNYYIFINLKDKVNTEFTKLEVDIMCPSEHLNLFIQPGVLPTCLTLLPLKT